MDVSIVLWTYGVLVSPSDLHQRLKDLAHVCKLENCVRVCMVFFSIGRVEGPWHKLDPKSSLSHFQLSNRKSFGEERNSKTF